MLLAGDVGGTKTRLALYQPHAHGLEQLALDQFHSKDWPSLTAMVEKFLSTHTAGGSTASVSAACFGIPGPVVNGVVKVTNLPWELSERGLIKEMGIPKIRLVNDLLATAASIPGLGSEAVDTLHPGENMRDRTVSAVLAPGTGTGQSFLCSMSGGRMEAFASEGGHVDFGPQNKTEEDLVTFLRSRTPHGGRVRVEDILCGPGIIRIHSFVNEVEGVAIPQALKDELNKASDKAAVITQSAMAGKYPSCQRAIELFAHALASQAGNLALTYMATGGVYLGGGIPPRITSFLQSPRVIECYLRKHPLHHVVQRTPLYIIKDDRAAVVGAGLIASQL